MFDSARLVETEDEPREFADSELPPREPIEFELTPGVKLEPREFPAFIAGEEARLAPPVAEFEERPAPLAPFMPPRTELFALEPPPARPK
jgi:hypothetical protein